MWDRICIVLYLACVRINVSEIAQHIKSAIFRCQEMSSEHSDFLLKVFTIIGTYMNVGCCLWNIKEIGEDFDAE